MYLLSFGIACTPTLAGVTARSRGDYMTIQELAHRLKAQIESDSLEAARAIIQDAEITEYSLYRPTSRWKAILEQLNLGSLEPRSACVTVYSADSSVFETVKRAAKKKYSVVLNFPADDMGFREIFLIGKDSKKEPDIILLVNWYAGSREETKAMYGDGTSEDTAEASDLDLDDIDPFE